MKNCSGCGKPLESLTIELSEGQVVQRSISKDSLHVSFAGAKGSHDCGQRFELRSEVESYYWLAPLVTVRG